MFKLKSIRSVKKVTICALAFITFTVNANIVNLTTEYSKTPIGIDVQFPRFSWQMSALPVERSIYQTAFQIVVKDPGGNICWDSGKIISGNSIGVSYAGIPLKASTRYTWDVRVWDRKGKTSTSSSWFETGLMNGNPNLEAWEGAEWIGGSDDDLVLYAPYERMGWSGDINVFSRTATYISAAGQFLRRHMVAMRDVQSAAGRFTDVAPVGGGFGGILWGSAGIVVPLEAYQQYGDKGLLEEHYPAMVKYLDYLETTIDKKTGISSDGALGDWLGPQNNQVGQAFITTAYHAYDLEIMSKVASLLGKPDDAEKYRKAYELKKEFFNRTFVSVDKKALGLIVGGRGFGAQPATAPELRVADVQTAYAVGLGMNLFNDENKPFMIKNLAEAVERENKDDGGGIRPKHSLMTGFIGTAWISKALSDNGLDDLAYILLQNNKYPSWLYSIEQGATTIWERLNGYTVEDGFGGNNSMNSFNHYSFGAVGQWMMAYSLGIQRDEPGFKKFLLQPRPDPTGQMTWARGYYDSMYGRISSSWRTENGMLTYEASVPGNTTARLYLPASSVDSIRENGKPVKKSKGVTFTGYEEGKAIFELTSGNYIFTAESHTN